MRNPDLTNQRFGKLTAIEKGEPHITSTTGKKRPRWLCKCDCGNEILIQTGSLTSGRANSCGCNKFAEDLTGRRFGQLTVIKRDINWVDPKTGVISVRWLCECDCGEIVRKFDSVLKAHKGVVCTLDHRNTIVSGYVKERH